MMQRIVVIGLGGVCLVLGGIVVAEALGGVVAVTTPAVATGVPPASGAAMATADPRHLDAVLLERPLFSRTRRPQAVTTAAASAPGGMPRLSGIMISPLGRLAIFAPAGGHPIVTHVGSRIGRFTVRGIGPDWVSVAGPHGVEVVRTAFSAATGPTAVTRPATTGVPESLIPSLGPGVIHTAGGITFDPSKPDLPSAATWSGPPALSQLPPPPRPSAASAPLLKPHSAKPPGPPG